MFDTITASIQRQEWCSRCSRYTRLDNLDRLVDGTLYDHLPYEFYKETEPGTDQPIELAQKRPSAQFRLPRWVARWSARKLFSGRHAPRIFHPDKAISKKVRTLARSARLFQKFATAVFLGSVGSIAVTFRIDSDGRVSLAHWRAKYCDPKFDEAGELAQLRLHYQTSGRALVALGATLPDQGNPDEPYWFIRDWTINEEITYQPVNARDWNPVDGFVRPEEGKTLRPWDEHVFTHGFGFVPGVWLVNLAGDTMPDGDATFEDAIPNSIDLDYNLSQIGRGIRYNAAPQLWIKGNIRNEIVRGPLNYIHLDSAMKDSDSGEAIGDGGAGLLEMSGTGIDAGLRFLEFERDLALEQIAASRKNPERLKGILSGRAMEFLEEDSSDLVAELRTQYGELGALPFLRKLVIATGTASEAQAAALALQWPRLFQPTPAEMAQLIPALRDAVTPIIDPATTGRPAGGGARPTAAVDRASNGGARTTGAGVRATFIQEVKTIGSLMDLPRARAFIEQALDLTMLDEDAEDDLPNEIELPNEVPADAPPPVDPTPLPETPEEAAAAAGALANQPEGGPVTPSPEVFGMRVGPPVRLDV